MDIERNQFLFRGGEQSGQYIRREDILNILADALQTNSYKNLQTQVLPRQADLTYTDNESFWKDALSYNHFPSAYIVLDDFNLMEWLPFSPGRYYTHEATRQRERAAYSVSENRNEYLPEGKCSMVRGGIGTIRLAEKTIDGHKIYFLGASSSGIAHQGIPVALPSAEYRKVISQIKEYGGCRVKIVGSLQCIAERMPSLNYDVSIPRYCLFVEDITVKEVCDPKALLVTVAAMFTLNTPGDNLWEDDYINNPILHKSWTFCSFYPNSSDRDVHSAAEWIADYVYRYSDGASSIITDFDEHYNVFPYPVEFPLSEIVRGRVDWNTLKLYKRYSQNTYIETYIEKVMGDNITQSGSGNTLVNRSFVQNAFNKIKSEYDDQTAEALTKIEEEINKSGNQEAADNFNSFNEELQKPEPKKSLLKTLWNGTVEALPTLKLLTDVVKTITMLFA